MNKVFVLGLAAGLISLGACNSSPTEQAADNIEAQADAVADNMEAIAANESDPSSQNRQNQADAVRDVAENEAEDMRDNGSGTNISNGL